MSYSYRIRFGVTSKGILKGDIASVAIETESFGPATLVPSEEGKSIEESEQFRLLGKGFESESQASEAARSLCDALLIFGLQRRVGIDVGRDDLRSLSMSAEFEAQLANQLQADKLIPDKLGITVFEDELIVKFIALNATGTAPIPIELVSDQLSELAGKATFATERARLAAELYGTSFFAPRVPARFLILFIALEALLSPERRSEDVIRHVDNLIRLTQDSVLDEVAKEAILSSLKYQKTESIGSAGRTLARSLPEEQRFGELTPVEFFAKMYKLRNDIVHRGTYEAKILHGVMGNFDQFVRDLILQQVVSAEI